jgi:hypothetical protein
MTSMQRDEQQIAVETELVTIRVSQAALIAAVDAMLRYLVRVDLTTCHNLQSLEAECRSDLCAADMELLREAQRHGVSIEERLQEALRREQRLNPAR